jgi:hypothetical protein
MNGPGRILKLRSPSSDEHARNIDGTKVGK